jgi:Polysaccharide biosynthesis C-terminal domain
MVGTIPPLAAARGSDVEAGPPRGRNLAQRVARNTGAQLGGTRQLVVLGLVAVTLNVALNLVLIPPYSYNVAAVATVASEAFAFAGTAFLIQRALRLQIEVPFIWRFCLATVGAVAVVATLRDANPWVACVLGEVAFLGLALALRLLTVHDIAVVLRRDAPDGLEAALATSGVGLGASLGDGAASAAGEPQLTEKPDRRG